MAITGGGGKKNKGSGLPGGVYPQVERRKAKKNWISTAVTIFSGVGWVGVFVWIMLLDRASPRQETFLDRLMNNPVKTGWNTQTLKTGFFVLIMVLGLCIIGFFTDLTQQRRKGDKINKSIITLGVLTLVGIGIYLLRFWDLMW